MVPRETKQLTNKKPYMKLSSEPSAQIGRPSSYRCVVFGVADLNGPVLLTVLVSFLYAFLTPWQLRRVVAGGNPTAFVWATSLLASSYFLIGTICLSKTTAKRFWFSSFFRIKPMITLSLVAAAHYFVRPLNSGGAVATLLSLYAAGVFGYAVAEHLQRVQTEEESCLDVVKLASDSEARQRIKQIEDPLYNFLFSNSIMSLIVLARIVWLVLHPASAVRLFSTAHDDTATNEAMTIASEITLETLFFVWQWNAFAVLALQEEAILSFSTIMYKVPAAVATLYILSGVFTLALGQVAGLLMQWSVAMALVGLFGYISSMFGRFREILRRNNRLPVWVLNNDLSQDEPSEQEDQRSSTAQTVLDEYYGENEALSV